MYAVDTSRVDRLAPHPLTAIGWGSIKPDNWQVIKAAKELSVNNDYRWSGPNYIQGQMATPDDPGYDLQWHYPLINLPLAWNVTTGSEDVVVAVIDTGVSDHPDLVSNVNYNLGYDFVSNTLNSGDGDGIDSDARDPGKSFPEIPYFSHGTHVAGTIGATSNNGSGVAGVNWDVTIMPVRVLGNDGLGSCWDISEGVKWAGGIINDSGTLPAKHADVINMSLAGPDNCPGSQELADLIARKGIVIIAAAGNETSSVPMYPASLDNVISVSATTISDDLAPYSSYGSTIDVAAPGGDMSADLNGDNFPDGVLSTVMIIEKGTSTRTNDFYFTSGTSMASPHIAGVAALMKSVYPAMGSNEFFAAISSGSITKDLAQDGPANKDPFFGYGRINARKAVNWALEQDGKPIPPYLTSSISSANFGSTQLSIAFEIGRGGSGPISVARGEVTESWMQLVAVSTDNDGLGTYRIDVDRTGLIDGSYSGWASIYGSDESEIVISVSMHVGEKVVGEAGYQYALLLDSWTLSTVMQWQGLAVNNEYPISFTNVQPGSYFLIVGSDNDNDFTICDQGELCQVYPLNNLPSEIIVFWDQNTDLGLFSMGFPDDVGGSNSSSSIGDPESQDENPNVSNIKAMIDGSGVSINK